MDILSYLFIFLMIALYAFQSFFCKKFNLSYTGNPSDTTPVFTIVGGLVVVIVTLFFSKFSFNPQFYTLLFGIGNAVALYFYNYFIIKSSACGPYSVLMLFSVVGGIVFPAIVKAIAFEEYMSVISIGFLILVLFSVYLMSQKQADEGDKMNRVTPKFLLYSLGLGICNGTYAVVLSIQPMVTGEGDKEELIMITFAVAAIFSLISLLLRRVNLKKAFTMTKKAAAHLILYALVAAVAVNALVIILLFGINTGVIYTVQNAGVMLMSVLLSFLFFKEKLSKVNLIGCVLMTVGLVGIMMF